MFRLLLRSFGRSVGRSFVHLPCTFRCCLFRLNEPYSHYESTSNSSEELQIQRFLLKVERMFIVERAKCLLLFIAWVQILLLCSFSPVVYVFFCWLQIFLLTPTRMNYKWRSIYSHLLCLQFNRSSILKTLQF